MAGLDTKFILSKIKINFYKNDKLYTSNYLNKDELIFEGAKENLTPKINFSLHTSRIDNLPEGSYKTIIYFEDDIFTDIFIKEISPSKTELRIGLSTDSNKIWTLWAFNPDSFWKNFNRFLTVNNNKFRIINTIPDYSDVNDDLLELQNQIDNSEDEDEINELTEKKNILAGKTTFIIKLDKPLNIDIKVPYEDKYTYLNTEKYESIEYENLYIYSKDRSKISNIQELSNEFKKLEDESFYNTGGKNYNDIVSTYSSSLFTFISSSLKNGVNNLNIDYSTIADFNYFGSFEQKLINVFKKVKNIETYNNLIYTYNSGSKSEASSSLNYYNKKNREIIDNFSLYEKYVYEKSGSYAWPKTANNINYSYSSSIVTNWYNSSIDEAQIFDKDNKNILIKNIPENVINNDSSLNITKMLYTWGDFFDEIKCYIDQIPYFWNTNYDDINSVPNDFLKNLGDALHQTMYEGYDFEELNTFALGQGLSTGSIKLQESTQEKWKRLLDNLPYLNKIKGTKRSIDTLLNIYGIPSSILRIREYGGGNKATGSAYIDENKNTYVLDINGDAYLRMPNNSYTQISGQDFTYELRFKTPNYLNANLFQNNNFTVSIITGSDSGSLRLDTPDENIHLSWSNTWYDDWNYIYLQRSGSIIKLGAKRYKDNQMFINMTGSTSIVDNNNFQSGTYVYFGSGSFSGSMQEIRLWKTALKDSEINHHAKDFDSVAMLNYSSSNDYLVGHWKLNDNRNLNTSAYVNDYNRTTNKYDMTAIGFTGNQFRNETINDNILELTNFNTSLYSDNKIYIGYNHSGSQIKNSNRVDLMFSPTDYINQDILSEFSMLDFNDVIGNSLDMYESNYSLLNKWRKYYFSKYSSNYNFFAFIKFIRNFDKSIFKIVRDLLPERASLKSGLIIRPNILERSKYQWYEPSISNHHYSCSTNIVDNDLIIDETLKLSENLSDSIWNTGSLSGTYSSLTCNCIYWITGSYGSITTMYTPGTKNITSEQINKLTYEGSFCRNDNVYQGAPVQVSQSAGTIIRVA